MFNLKKSREALDSFKKAKELDDKVGHPFVFMARLFANQDDKLNAKKAFEKAYNEDKSDETVAQAYAEWLIQQDELSEAQQVATTLRQQAPDSIQALLLDGIISLMRGDRKNSEQALSEVLNINPAHPAATNILALLLIESDQKKDRTRARNYAEMNAQRFPKSTQANITHGWVLYNLGLKAEHKSH